MITDFIVPKKLKSLINAVDSIWKDIIRPEKPKQIGDLIRFSAYLNYRNLIETKIARNKNKPFAIDFSRETSINISENDLNNFQLLVKKAFKKIDSVENRKRSKLRYMLLWGAKLFKIEKASELALKRNAEIVFVEDGFYRSVCGGLKNVDKVYSNSHSLTFDDCCPHYDGNHTSRLELLLADNDKSYLKEESSVETIKSFIIENNLSKYNDQRDFIAPAIGCKEKKVLVIMQSYNDASVTIVGGDSTSFSWMIEDAIKENPDADILVKVHPDTLIKNNKGYADAYLNDKRVYIIDAEISLPSLLKYVDHVYVFSSQAGFEALLYGKHVTTYGKPFYAGWGLTRDKGLTKVRGRISFNKMFYDVNYRYTYFWDPENGTRVDPYTALQLINSKRSEYLNRNPKKGLLIKLDGLGDWVIFSDQFKKLKQTAKYKDCDFDFLGDNGFKDFFKATERDFSETYWIHRRGSGLLDIVNGLEKRSTFLGKIANYLYLSALSVQLKRLFNTEYDVVIVSCWNNGLQKYINKIVRRLNAKFKIGRMVFHNVQLEKEQRKTYSELIPISGDHLKIFRGDLERSFVENLCNEKLPADPQNVINKEIKEAFIFCGAFHKKRRLEQSKYVDLAIALSERGIKAHVYGLPEGVKFKAIDGNVDFHYGISPANEIVSAIRDSDIYIGNDTGFFHYAVSLGKLAVVVSNGNSLNTFVRYPNNKNIKYIFPKSLINILNDADQSTIDQLTRSSELDINEISTEILVSETLDWVGYHENCINWNV